MPRKPLTQDSKSPEERAQVRARTVAHQEQTRRANAEAKALRDAEKNPLLDLPDKDRARLFGFLRDCPYDDAMKEMARDIGIGEVTSSQLDDFFQLEAEDHWATRIERAAHEANALIRLAEENPAHFSSGILAALGQEVFRQVASGQAQPDAMNKMAMLFLRARADVRADQLGELKREKLRQEMQGQVGQALEKLAEEVSRKPAAREAFEVLQRELGKEEA